MEIEDKWFTQKKIDDDITLIWEPYVHPVIRCNMWHIKGRSRDLLIDTGLGIASLKDAAKNLFGSKLTVVATHYHFDHVGGIAEFQNDTCVIHESETEQLITGSDGMALTRSALGTETIEMLENCGYNLDNEELITAYPYAGFDPNGHPLTTIVPAYSVKEGDVIDLGNRFFEVLHLPGHSPGSIGLWEKETKTLFSGDAIYDGPLLDNLPDSNIDDYIHTMKRLIELPVNIVHAGHEQSFSRDRLREIAMPYLKKWA